MIKEHNEIIGTRLNLLNHGNYLGRGLTVYGNTDTPAPTFGPLVGAGAASTALPAFANVDAPRMFQFQARFIFWDLPLPVGG
jgi:hypothetical protein